MSHFTVTVRVSAETLKKHKGDHDRTLETVLAPYQESPSGVNRKYLVFDDVEDKFLNNYNTKSTECLRSPDGELLSKHDEKFQSLDAYTFSRRTVIPDGFTPVTVPFKTMYGSFEEYCQKWEGSKRDRKSGRHGYWKNPNAKWDWYAIGGRWSQFYPKMFVSTKVDIIYVKDIDMKVVLDNQLNSAKEFFDEYQRLLNGKSFNSFDGPRGRALCLGLLRVEKKRVTASDGEVAFPWNLSANDNRNQWTDIASRIDWNTFKEKYFECFNPLITYAVLDDDGWHSAGDMGWFGSSTDEPNDSVKFQREFVSRFITNARPDDTLIIVDCHT